MKKYWKILALLLKQAKPQPLLEQQEYVSSLLSINSVACATWAHFCTNSSEASSFPYFKLVLNEGKIAGIGTHEELLKNCDTYYEIASSQLSEEELKNGRKE